MTRMNHNNFSGINNAPQTTATSTASSVLGGNVPDHLANNIKTKTANQAQARERGVWYQHNDDDGSNITKNQYEDEQFYSNSNSNNNYNENIEREEQNAFWKTNNLSRIQHDKRNDIVSNSISKSISNNISDIIVVDIEDEEEEYFAMPPKLIIDASMKYRQHTSTLHDIEQVVDKVNNNNNNNNDNDTSANNDVANNNDDLNDDDDADEDDDDDNDDSLASMETLSDNVSIWIDGEKHWVAGVDDNTTCSDLIWALLNYQNGQQHQQHMYKVGGATEIDRINVYERNNHQQQQQQHPKQLQEQQHTKEQHNNDADNKYRSSSNGITTILYNKPNKYFSSDTMHTSITTTTTSNTITTHTTAASINQSMPINTKENCKLTQNLYPVAVSVAVAAKKSTVSSLTSTAVSPLRCLPFAGTFPLPPGITTAAQLATEYVIVKQYHHCEEYLDGSTKVFEVLPSRDGPHKKECELLLRHLGPAPAPAVYNNNAATPQLSSLISTDKDSGMGSPVGSARSAKFRRRKHKSSQWLAQANTLHPKLSRCTANERLMKIILAQDETIQRQLSLLRDKEFQITKIEEEKHRKRERELGKNYLLETYLNGLDEAECEPEIQDGVEIFIDEPYQRRTMTTGTTKMPETRRTAEATTIAGVHETLQAKTLMAQANLNKEIEIVSKDKNKKRCHREKIAKEDFRNATTSITQITEFKSRTNKDKDRDRDRDRNKDKEKLPNRQGVHHRKDVNSSLTVNTSDDIITIDSNEQEITLQIQWLEKIYTLNKQLQKEEELTAKLHAKVRKHQLRKAQQTQKEVQMEIDKLDDNLALQCGDIRKIEANLMETNEQLQKKLYILERLSVDYLQQQQQNTTDDTDDRQQHLNNLSSDHQQRDNSQIIGNLKNSLELQRLSLSNLKSSEGVKQLQEVIEKPCLEINNNNALSEMTLKETSKNPIHHTNQSQSNEYFNESLTNSMNTTITLNPSSRHQLNNIQDYHHHHHQQQQQQPQQQQHDIGTTSSTILPLATIATTIAVNTTTAAGGISTKTTMSTSSCMFIDKNMLSSLPVQNAKTITKQMFHAQTSRIARTATTTAASPVIASTRAAVTMETNANKFPKQQFQHITQHMPRTATMATASTILTSRPQTSHQIPTPIVILKHPSALPSTALTSAPVPTLAAPATTTSSSPTPSLMAMNTVDISQLGTLV